MTPITVYLIDDEPELVELLSDVIELIGLRTKGFIRASSFFEQFSQFEPNAILILDLHMPEMDGIEVMRRLAKLENPPSVILISGTDSGVLYAAEKLGHAHNLNIIASLSKPVPLDRLQYLLQEYALTEQRALGNSHKPSVSHTLTAGELHKAILQDELTLHYQPQIDIATGELIGLEALVRWQHPILGLVFPDYFVPLAEKNGLIGELTHWVVARAVQQEQLWQSEGFIVAVSINISAHDITSLTLPDQMTQLLANNQLDDPTRLTLEVTESALMGELVTSLDILTRLRLKGIGLSIDDFGTGYSSLSQLHRVPFTELKIDQSFVINMLDDAEARAIVKTCIILGHELNMQVVAEGVETKAHYDLLKEMQCDRAQGYYICKPISPRDIRLKYDHLCNSQVTTDMTNPSLKNP